MSRGPGRVMRAVLEHLESRPLDTAQLAHWAGADLGSTRRALRTLHRAGRVHCLGQTFEGYSKWCLTEHRNLFSPPWAQVPETLGELLGKERWKRLWTSAL